MAAQDLNLAARFQSGSEEDVLEERLVDVIGAGASHEKRALRHFRQDDPVEFLVSPKAICDIVALFDECGRIEDDKIVRKIGCFEKFEKVRFDELVIGEVVQSEIFFDRFAASGANLDAVDMGSAAS